MLTIYNSNAAICAKFYDLTLNPKKVAEFVFKNSQALPKQNALFVGGLFSVAAELINIVFKILRQADNFDETSFYTLAQI